MLTGTPLQNDLAELQNLLAFLLPSVFSEEAENLEQLTADMQVQALACETKALLYTTVCGAQN